MDKPFNLTLRVVWWMQFVQFVFAFIFVMASISTLPSVFKGETSIFTIFGFVFFIYLGCANALSTIKITDESVTVTVFYGRFRICWNEVEKILWNGSLIALIGNDKRIVLSMEYAGRNAPKMMEYFKQQIAERKISFEQKRFLFPIIHRNARVWR
jgi:hypothetical protein